MPTIDEFFGTSNQVCGGFWPFGTDMALPAEGVPVGRSLMTGAGVCCDPISWFKAGIIKQPSMFLLGLPAIGKSTFVRREVLGLSALGMNAIIPGDLKPDYASLVNMLGGQVIQLGAGIGVVNPLDPGDLHYALQRLEGKARKDLTDYYNDTRAALMEVLFDDHAHRPRGRRRGRCQGRDRTRIRYPFRGRARAPRPAWRRSAASRHRGPARPAARRARRGAYGGGLGRPGKTTSSTGRRFAAFWPTCTDSRTA